MTRFTARLACMLVLLSLTGTALAQTEEVERTLTAAAGTRFDLTNISGDISIAGVAGREVTIRAIKRLRDDDATTATAAMFDRVEIDVSQRGDRIGVETEYRNDRGGAISVDYVVTLPRDLVVSVESVSGDVTLRDIDGRTQVEVVSGDLELTGLAHLVEVQAVSGQITVRDVTSEQRLSVATVSGSLTLENVRAPRLDTGSVNGSITLSNVEADRLEAETVSGAVSFAGPLANDGRYEFQSHAGRIRLTVPADAGFELEAESFSGAFRSQLPVDTGDGGEATEFPRGNRSLDGIVNGGGARLETTTFSGSITIEVS